MNRTWALRDLYYLIVWKPSEKGPNHKWEGNIKMYLTETRGFDSSGTGNCLVVCFCEHSNDCQKSKLCYDRQFRRPVRLGVKHPSGA
jgi:hypothetical protein